MTSFQLLKTKSPARAKLMSTKNLLTSQLIYSVDKFQFVGFELSNIQNQLISKRLSIIEFGIKFYSTSKVSIGSPIDEEYPRGEEIPKSLRSKVISSHGLGVGFGVVYAIYLHFLETDSNKLAEFLKKERIPNSDKYCKSLIKLYRP